MSDAEIVPAEKEQISEQLKRSVFNLKDKLYSLAAEYHTEIKTEYREVVESNEGFDFLKKNWAYFFHIPYLPPLSNPGWLTR